MAKKKKGAAAKKTKVVIDWDIQDADTRMLLNPTTHHNEAQDPGYEWPNTVQYTYDNDPQSSTSNVQAGENGAARHQTRKVSDPFARLSMKRREEESLKYWLLGAKKDEKKGEHLSFMPAPGENEAQRRMREMKERKVRRDEEARQWAEKEAEARRKLVSRIQQDSEEPAARQRLEEKGLQRMHDSMEESQESTGKVSFNATPKLNGAPEGSPETGGPKRKDTTPDKARRHSENHPDSPEPDDSWLDDWDLTIHRCSTCRKPFRSSVRLVCHQSHYCKGTPYRRDTQKQEKILSTPLVEIVSDGDLEIQVGPDTENIERRFLVASQVLRYQSQVFSASFSQKYGFKGSTDIRRAQLLHPSEPAVIYLDDNCEALEIVLKVLHYRHNDIPPELGFKVLIELAALVEKYMLHIPLAPMATKWAKKYVDKVSATGYENWILISWVFGFTEVFESMSRRIIWRLRDKQGDKIERLQAGTILHSALPESVLVKLHTGRNQALEPIRKRFEVITSERLFKQSIRPQSEDSPTPPTICKASTRQQECDWFQLGHLMEATRAYGLDTEEFWLSSSLHITTIFRDIPVKGTDIFHPNALKNSRSDPCSWVEMMQAICPSIPSISPLKLTDFASRREIWGAFNHEQIKLSR